MICVCVCMNSNDVWAVSVKISSSLLGGCRVKVATTQMLVNLVMTILAAMFGDYSEYINTDQYAQWQSDFQESKDDTFL